MKTCHLAYIPSSSWNRWYFEQAVASLVRSMEINEDWLLRALLGCNDDANLFRNKSSRDVWRGRDYLYALMTEKDIQARLAAGLFKFDRCHVHVEVPVYGRTNRKKRRRPKPYNLRPDIFLLSTRRKEKRKASREKHLEVTAIEIKYFDKSDNPWMKQMIKYDVGKLHDYLNARVRPRVDNGFFLCIDETGRAETVLKGILSQGWMKGQHIGYFVVVPRYLTEGRDNPMALEQYRQGFERSSAYVMGKALGMLRVKFPSAYNREALHATQAGKYRGSAGPWFYLRLRRKRIGWVYLDWRFKVGRNVHPALIVNLNVESDHVGNPDPIKWSDGSQGYRYTEKHLNSRIYFVTSRSFEYELKKMNRMATKIYGVAKRLLQKAERRLAV